MQKIILDSRYSAAITELQPRKILSVCYDSKKWIICAVGESRYIMPESCPHAGASLAEGACNIKGIIVCPLHGYKFDIARGRSADAHEYLFKRYILKYSGDTYFFEL